MLKLIVPEERYLPSFIEAYDEYVNNGVKTYHFDNARAYDVFEKFERFRRGENLNPGIVGADFYWLVDDHKDYFVGEISIRHRLNNALEKRGGHIGYGIRVSEWNKGFGTFILKLGFEKAKARGLSKLMITCNDDNIGSARVMEKNGMILQDKIENIVDGKQIITRRYTIDLRGE